MSSKEDKKAKKAAAKAAEGADEFVIKPEEVKVVIDTSNWPLLLKDYNKLLVRSGHYTPIPGGWSPLKRPIKEYIQ